MAKEKSQVNLRQTVSGTSLFERGKQLRHTIPIEAHDRVVESVERPGVLDFIDASNRGRLPHLIPLRIGRMVSSPFAFYRGSAGLMAADLAASPVSGIEAQLCGDAHAANFGLYGTPEGDIVMDINDFDETIVGPWEWDLKRLSTSLVLAGREGGVPDTECVEAAEDAVKSYRRTIRELAQQPFLQSWSALPDQSVITRAKADALLDDFAKAAKKASRNTSARVAEKWTAHFDDHETGVKHRRFVEEPPTLTSVDADVADAVIDGLERYVDTLRESRRNLIGRYSVADVAFRIVGTGSVGLRSYVALLLGNTDEVLVLQIKQAQPSSLAPYLSAAEPSHEGKRIVHGARLVQAETDILLGWTTIDGIPYIVRQFRNLKGDIDPSALEADHLDDYGRLAGALLARAHSRSLDPRLLSGYLAGDQELDEVIGRFAVRYADHVEADHAVLAEAVRAGRMAAESG
ncbi:DUF2252 domain-containing protein [Gordonia sp. NPDC003585]|uniref:DUF2252 domain-containing protein n=1 Tax=unclassified Gordonia (in: high G+C Gram-positive bacteria) TaxID=2657482 RepID=UPI0033AE5149